MIYFHFLIQQINAERGVDEIFADVQAAIDNAVANKKQAATAALS